MFVGRPPRPVHAGNNGNRLTTADGRKAEDDEEEEEERGAAERTWRIQAKTTT